MFVSGATEMRRWIASFLLVAVTAVQACCAQDDSPIFHLSQRPYLSKSKPTGSQIPRRGPTEFQQGLQADVLETTLTNNGLKSEPGVIRSTVPKTPGITKSHFDRDQKSPRAKSILSAQNRHAGQLIQPIDKSLNDYILAEPRKISPAAKPNLEVKNRSQTTPIRQTRNLDQPSTLPIRLEDLPEIADTEASVSEDSISTDKITKEEIEQRLFNNEHAFGLTLEESMRLAVDNSPELKALQADVIINNEEIIRQDANFDFSHFTETLYDQESNPVGSDLDGVQGRLRSKLWNIESGLRKKTRLGGDLSLSQQFGHLNSNSIFINPNNQATGQLGLEWVQPLARGGSRDVNRAGIDLARISATSSQAVLRTEIQERLLEIVKAYWSLVLSRGKLVQMNRSVFRAEQTTQQMAQRQEIDVLPQQLIRGQAAVARRKAAAGQAKFEALKTQEVLMRLIFGDQYQAKETFEIVPLTSQPGEIAISSLSSGLLFGVQNRPEIHSAMQDIHASAVRNRIAINDLKPQLDLVFSLFGKGLRGSSNFRNAFTDQFVDGEPSFQIGLNYELPYGNRSARANANQTQITTQKFQNQLQTVINNVVLEIREQDIVRAQYQATSSLRRRSLELAKKELETIQIRKQFLLDGNQIATLYLDDLLQAQDRVQQAETDYLESITSYGISQAAWLRAIGGLDQYDQNVQVDTVID